MSPLEKLQSIPHLELGFYPTPLEELPRLRTALGANAPRIFIKRDDYTGAGFGGNKVRKLEYVLAQVLAEGHDAVITIGGIRSNHCRVTAALCAKLGLRCILVLNAASLPLHKPASVFVEELYGAEIHVVSNRDERKATMYRIAGELRHAGVKVYEVPLGASTPLGALGYVKASVELSSQLQTQGLQLDAVVHSSSSGGTQAGILTGFNCVGLEHVAIYGVSPDDPATSIQPEVASIAVGLAEILELESAHPPIRVLDSYIGAGYGIPTPESEAALQLVAKTEGIILDHTYVGKAMVALLEMIRLGKFSAQDAVLFWHTGGQLAHFHTA